MIFPKFVMFLSFLKMYSKRNVLVLISRSVLIKKNMVFFLYDPSKIICFKLYRFYVFCTGIILYLSYFFEIVQFYNMLPMERKTPPIFSNIWVECIDFIKARVFFLIVWIHTHTQFLTKKRVFQKFHNESFI